MGAGGGLLKATDTQAGQAAWVLLLVRPKLAMESRATPFLFPGLFSSRKMRRREL